MLENRELYRRDIHGYIIRIRQDYFIGDKVAVKNAYGMSASATVTEVTEVEDSEGYRLVPTLSEWTITPTEEE